MNHILVRARSYCAAQERCRSEVERKLSEWKTPSSLTNRIIDSLMKDGFLDEVRFAKAFAGGKFRISKWGKTKITHELKHKGVPEAAIRGGLEEIGEEEYEETLTALLSKKSREIKETDPFKRKQKLIGFAMQRGFHPDLIHKILELKSE